MIGGGVLYLLLWIYGLVVDKTSDANFVPLNSPDDWLHFGLGVGMTRLGVALSRSLRSSRPGRVQGTGRLPPPRSGRPLAAQFGCSLVVWLAAKGFPGVVRSRPPPRGPARSKDC